MRIDIEGVVVTKGVGNVPTKIGEGEVETVRKDELGGVRKDELVEKKQQEHTANRMLRYQVGITGLVYAKYNMAYPWIVLLYPFHAVQSTALHGKVPRLGKYRRASGDSCPPMSLATQCGRK